MQTKKRFALILTTLLTCVWSWAGPGHDMEPYKGSSEFERVKSLAGYWEGTTTEMAPDPSKPMTIATDFKVTSGGSAVVETLFPGTPHEMVNVYTDEGGKLEMTHYCMMRNQPHMKLTKSTAHTIALEVPAGDPSVAPGTDAMKSLTLEISKPDEIKQTWISYSHDTAKPASTFTFKRKDREAGTRK